MFIKHMKVSIMAIYCSFSWLTKHRKYFISFLFNFNWLFITFLFYFTLSFNFILLFYCTLLYEKKEKWNVIVTIFKLNLLFINILFNCIFYFILLYLWEQRDHGMSRETWNQHSDKWFKLNLLFILRTAVNYTAQWSLYKNIAANCCDWPIRIKHSSAVQKYWLILFVLYFLCKNVHWQTMHNKTTDMYYIKGYSQSLSHAAFTLL